MYESIGRFASQPEFTEPLDRLFVCDDWREGEYIADPVRRRAFFPGLYERQLRKAGAKSVPGARAMYVEWVRVTFDSSVRSEVPLFFKQWGGVFKKRAGRALDGRTWDEMPAA